MRRFYLLLVTVLFLSDIAWASPVDPTEARNLAQTFYRLHFPEQTPPVFEEISQSVGVSHFYIFNNTNGPGFVMISGDDCAIPILGYSGSNNCKGGEMRDNILSWLGYYDGTIGAAVLNGDVATPEIAEQWSNLRDGYLPEPQSVTAVAPLLATTWDQIAPYNNLCPGTGSDKAYVGCVATAMAQLMKFYNWPTTGTGSNSYISNNGTYNYGTLSANFGATTYDWNNMLNNYPYANSGTATQQNAVATLMYHCGVSVNMSYSPEWSGAYVTDIEIANWQPNYPTAEKALKNYFKYSTSLIGLAKANYTSAQWTSMLKADLDNGRPILYDGTDQTGQGGHCFVCDGYDNSNYFHFNWGWSGWYDGYFQHSNLTPGTGGAGAGNSDYSYNQSAIFGAVPNNGGSDSTGCEYLHYPLPGSLDFYVLSNGGGYVSGTNYYGDIAKADFFTYSGSGTIESLNVTFGAIDGISGSLVFTVWDDNNGTPGNVLGNKTVSLATIYNASVNQGFNYECVFDSPIAITGNFFAGIDFSSATSSVGIITTTDGSAANTGWEMLSDGTWIPYNSSNSWGMSLTHAIHPYVCPVTSPDPNTGNYQLVMYEAFSYSPNPMQQNQSVTVTASVGNAGTDSFNGSFKLSLLNANNTEVQVIGQQSLSSPLTSMIYTPLTFSGMVTVPAGTYQMALYYQATGASTWTLVSNEYGVANPISVTVTGGSNPPVTGTGLNMFTDFLYTPDPLRQNTVAYLTVGVINLDNTAFTGNLRLALETSEGEHVQTIQQIPVTTPVASNNYAQFNFSGNITADPGFYNLILYYKPDGGTSWMTVGNGYNAAYQNPKSVMVTYPNGIGEYAMDAASLRPNPASDHFYIDLTDQDINRIEILTTTGQIVHTQDNVLNGESIDISFLGSGVYFVRYETSETVGTLKLVVK
jgi:hypothetical protein